MKNACHIYRQLLKVTRNVVPSHQFSESKQLLRNMILETSERFVASNYDQRVLEEGHSQASAYIERMKKMSEHSIVETHSPQYWNSFYGQIWADYQQQRTEKMSSLTDYLKQRNDLIADWYCDYEYVRDVVLSNLSHVKKKKKKLQKQQERYRVLILGNGLSYLPFGFWKEMRCYNVCCVDVSESVTIMMQQVAKEMELPVAESLDLPGLHFYCSDVRHMDNIVNCESFDLVLDKATVDSLWLEDAYEERPASLDVNKGEHNLQLVQQQVHRLLKPGGQWFIFSHFDDLHLTSKQANKTYGMDIQLATDPDRDNLFIYLLTRV